MQFIGVWHLRSRLRAWLWLGVLAALVLGEVAAPPSAQPALAAPDDTPIPVASGNIEEWSVGAGLVYWADNCFADEFNPFANLFRIPAGGGTQRTVLAINDGNRCLTFRNQLAATDGLYYADLSGKRIVRMPPGEPFNEQGIKTLADAQMPANARGLVEAGAYLYWMTGFPSSILRTLKDGSGPVETVANSGVSGSDLIVVGTTVYWTDSAGVWQTTTNCATLPCPASQFAPLGANTAAYGLLYQGLGGPLGNFRVYWVERSGPNNSRTYTIKYRSCNQITVCTIAQPSTFYSSTVNWLIGFPVLAGNNLYWTEADTSTVNSPNGDVKRRAYNAAQGAGADTIATGQPGLDSRVFATADSLFFARRSVGIYRLPLNATAILRDFAADGLEVTQAIQNLANSAPLVAQKQTYVRVYGRELSGPNTANVEAWLAGTRNGTPLPGSPLRPINGVRALTTGGSFDRARLDDGWYFRLPDAWTTAGAVALSAVIDPRSIHTDPNLGNNTLAQTVSFQSQPPMCVWTVPVRTHNPLPSTTDPNFWGMVSQYKRRWPIPDVWVYRDTDPVEELQVCWYGPFPYPCYGPYELSDGWSITNGPPDRDKVITSLWTRALLTYNPDACDNIGAPVNFMGMVHPNADNGGASGYASTISSQSWVQLPPRTPNPIPAGWDKLRAGSVMAQELGHNFGRKHVNCGNPDNTDGSYPYPPCQLANVGPTSYYGFDTTTLQPIRPDQAADFMSYGSKTWVSDYTWRALFNSFAAQVQTAAGAAQGGRSVQDTAALAGNAVFITGLVDKAAARGQIATVLQLPAATLPPATQALLTAAPGIPASDLIYSLRLLDAAGNVLVARTPNLQPLDDHAADSDSHFFSEVLTPPTGQVARIVLMAGDTVLDSITPGVHPPTISVQQPAAGTQVDSTLTVQWTASDPDPQDRLKFTVQYSHDAGASWHTIALDVPATPNPVTTLTLDELGSLHGSGPNQALIRVLASDGYNTTIAQSQPFTLKNRPPDVAITAPGAGQVFPAGATVMLQGNATDAEDGGLAAGALQWQVDGAGVGSGTAAAAAGLAPGAHTVQLAATDANAQVGTASAPFTVAPLSLPLAAAPALDGACEDDAYTHGVDLALKPYGDGSQGTVRLVRSTDALWACFSGLKQAAAGPGAFAGVRADVDNSRSAQAQPADFGFFAAEDGSVFTQAGDGAGSFSAAALGGLQAQVSAGGNAWSAELRIPAATLGGWDHLVGLAFGHHSLGAAGDDYPWPFRAGWGQPNTWAVSALGDQPVITALDPFTATVNGPAFTLAIEGSGFVSGTVALWNGNALATTVTDGEHLSAQVDAALLQTPGMAQVSARTPANFTANNVPFLVAAGQPAISALVPNAAIAGSGALALTVQGSGFDADSQVLWNGVALPTQVLSASQLKVQVDAARLVAGGVAGVSVRSATPEERSSLPSPFVVLPQNVPLFMPFLHK